MEIILIYSDVIQRRDRRSRDRMVVGFTTIFAISAYHHCCCEFESRSGRGVQHYVIKFASPPISSSNKTDRHDITEILLKVALNTNKQTDIQRQLSVSCKSR
jgi:hypothetical protein